MEGALKPSEINAAFRRLANPQFSNPCSSFDGNAYLTMLAFGELERMSLGRF
jgi:hypothetical protein